MQWEGEFVIHRGKSDIHGGQFIIHGGKSDIHRGKSDIHGGKSDIHGGKFIIHGGKPDTHRGQSFPRCPTWGGGFHPSSSHPAPHSVAVTRSKDVPPFGPPIPSGVTFRKSDVFRDFLLAKTINAENAAHKSAKFRAMATRTRREYLKDLAENFVTNTPIDSSGKFNLISLTSKKKEKTKARVGAELHSAGAIAWRVSAQDFARGVEIPSILGISNEFVVLLDLGAKEVVFNCFCGDVIGWTADGANLKVFYGRGDHICVRAAEGGAEDVKEIVQRLKVGGG